MNIVDEKVHRKHRATVRIARPVATDGEISKQIHRSMRDMGRVRLAIVFLAVQCE